MRWILLGLLRLHPRRFRQELGEPWLHTATEMVGREQGLARLRVASRLVIDSLLALPEAYRARQRDRVALRARLAWELAQALQGLVRQPRFTAMCGLVLAIGLGVNTAVFSVANAALLRPLQYAEPERLVVVWGDWRAAGFSQAPLSPAQLDKLGEAGDVFESIGGLWASSSTITGGEYPEQVSVGQSTASLFSTLGVPPAMGRLLRDDDAADPTAPDAQGSVLLSHAFWQRYFGGDPNVLGMTLRMNGTPHQIVGVMPERFQFRFPPGNGVPTHLDAFVPYPPLQYLNPDQYYLRVVGRLRPGLSTAAAQAALEEPARDLRELRPDLADSDVWFDVRQLNTEWTSHLRVALIGVQAGALLLLFLTLTNVTSLMVTNAVARQPAFAVCSCLGAERRQLARQLIGEGMLLAAAASALGMALGAAGLSLLWTVRPASLEHLADVSADGRVALFAIGAAIVSVLFLSVGPVLLLSRSDLSRFLLGRPGEGSGRLGIRMRRVASVAQIAATFALLVGTSLMAATVANLQQVEPGFQVPERLTFKISLSSEGFAEGATRDRVVREVRQEILDLPGVESVGAGSHMPLGSWVNWANRVVLVESPDDPSQQGIVDHRMVTPGYFNTLGTRLISGREFDAADDAEGERVAVLDTVLAERLFGHDEALGRRVIVSHWRDDHFENVAARIVGVTEPLRDRSIDEPSTGQVYLPWAQAPRWEIGYMLRGRQVASLTDSIRDAVAGVNADLAVAGLHSFSDDYDRAVGPQRFALLLAGVIAGAAVLLSAIGIYGVLMLETHSRYREIGIRMAVGARAEQVNRMILGSGLRLAALGIGLGVPLALGFATLVNAGLFGVERLDLRMYVPAAIVVVVMGTAAAALPARRATRHDPALSLRGGTLS